jgi:hypothetical protein
MRTVAVTHTYPRSELSADCVVDSLDEITIGLIEQLTVNS